MESRATPASSPHAADIKLLREARQGVAEARHRLVERMRCIPRILAIKNARMGHPLGADELADLGQETFAAVWAKADTYAGKAKLETWVAGYCVFLFMNRLRQLRRRRFQHLQEEPPTAHATSAEAGLHIEDAREELHRALEELPREAAQVIHWRFLDQMSFEQIAARLEVPVNTAKTRYYRGMDRLRTLLRPAQQERAR